MQKKLFLYHQWLLFYHMGYGFKQLRLVSIFFPNMVDSLDVYVLQLLKKYFPTTSVYFLLQQINQSTIETGIFTNPNLEDFESSTSSKGPGTLI